MALIESREFHLKQYPEGVPGPDSFQLEKVNFGKLNEGDILIKNIWMSVDPYMRGRMIGVKTYAEPFEIGEVLYGGAIGQVIESLHADYKPGCYVKSMQGWREYFISKGEDLDKIDCELAPPQTYLGVMGMPGMTAYVGLLYIGEVKPEDTVFVSAASGAVGSLVCQIAKMKGCRVVGSAGSEQKINWLIDEAKIDAAINYKTAIDFDSQLSKACPDGIDVYYDNVGGKQLEAALNLMNQSGRIVVCGTISNYNDTEPKPGPSNLRQVLVKRLKMQGFIVSDHMELHPEFIEQMSKWIADGKLKWRETIVEGIENAPAAFIGLFKGDNIGKMLVKLGDPETF